MYALLTLITSIGYNYGLFNGNREVYKDILNNKLPMNQQRPTAEEMGTRFSIYTLRTKDTLRNQP